MKNVTSYTYQMLVSLHIDNDLKINIYRKCKSPQKSISNFCSHHISKNKIQNNYPFLLKKLRKKIKQ